MINSKLDSHFDLAYQIILAYILGMGEKKGAMGDLTKPCLGNRGASESLKS